MQTTAIFIDIDRIFSFSVVQGRSGNTGDQLEGSKDKGAPLKLECTLVAIRELFPTVAGSSGEAVLLGFRLVVCVSIMKAEDPSPGYRSIIQTPYQVRKEGIETHLVVANKVKGAYI